MRGRFLAGPQADGWHPATNVPFNEGVEMHRAVAGGDVHFVLAGSDLTLMAQAAAQQAGELSKAD